MHFEHHDLHLCSWFFQNILNSHILQYIYICRRFCHTRVLWNSACELLMWEALEALDVRVRFLRHPMACSWRSLSTCDTTTAVVLSLYTRERTARAQVLGCHCSWSLSRFACFFDTRFVCAASLLSTLPALPICILSLPALSLCSRVFNVLLSTMPALSSHLCSRLCSRLCSASVSSLPRLRLSFIACEYNISFSSPVAERVV